MAVPVVHAFPDQQTDEQPVESTIEEQQPQKPRQNFDAESDDNYEIRLLQEAIDKENSNRSNSKPIEHKETTVDGYQDACNQIETERQQLLEEEMFMNEMKESKQRMSRPASARKLSRQNSASGSVGKDKTKKKKKTQGPKRPLLPPSEAQPYPSLNREIQQMNQNGILNDRALIFGSDEQSQFDS